MEIKLDDTQISKIKFKNTHLLSISNKISQIEL